MKSGFFMFFNTNKVHDSNHKNDFLYHLKGQAPEWSILKLVIRISVQKPEN